MSGSFPRDLLGKPAEARLAYFRSFTMAHPLLKEADQALREAIHEPGGRSLIFVYGRPEQARPLSGCAWRSFSMKLCFQHLPKIPGELQQSASKLPLQIRHSSVGKITTGGRLPLWMSL